jgi:hypothetical protein
LLTSDELQQALAEQRRSGKLLGEVVLGMGFVAQADLLTVLAKQQGIALSPIVEQGPREEQPKFEQRSASGGARTRTLGAVAIGMSLGIVVALGGAMLATRHPHVVSVSHATLVAPLRATNVPEVAVIVPLSPTLPMPATTAGHAEATNSFAPTPQSPRVAPAVSHAPYSTAAKMAPAPRAGSDAAPTPVGSEAPPAANPIPPSTVFDPTSL